MRFPPASLLSNLVNAPMRSGKLSWVGVRPARHAPMAAMENVTLIAERGIVGDRYQTSRNGGRQVTLIAAEDIAAIAAFLGRENIAPELFRRNFVTRGVNLVALKGLRFRVGAALLEGAGDCAPCSKMEAALGAGAYNAMRGRGGLTARILEGGEVCRGDAIIRED